MLAKKIDYGCSLEPPWDKNKKIGIRLKTPVLLLGLLESAIMLWTSTRETNI